MDMQFYWLRDRIRQGHFHVYWKQGILNLGDYVTKHHSSKHHQAVRPTYVCNYINLPDQQTTQRKPNLPIHPTNLKLQRELQRTLHCKGVLESYVPTVHDFSNYTPV